MRRWMVAGGAVVMAAAGMARAHEPSSERGARDDGAAAVVASTARRAPAMARGSPAEAKTGDDRSGFVTHDELDRVRASLLEQIEREQRAQRPEPAFTDAG